MHSFERVADAQVYFVVLMSHVLRDTLSRFSEIDASCYIFLELLFLGSTHCFYIFCIMEFPGTYFIDQKHTIEQSVNDLPMRAILHS
jgi:hypothetical protein